MTNETTFKPTQFSNLTPGQKKNSEVITAHLEYYKTKTEEGENHPQYKLYLKHAKTQAEVVELQQARSNQFSKLVHDNDIWHVAKTDKLYKRGAGELMYSDFPINGLCRNLGVKTDNDSINLLMEAIRLQGRSKERATVSFGKVSSTQFNMLGNPQFLEPSSVYDEEDKWWFDLLLDSISGENQDVRDHIEKTIVYKYLHPEAYELPMLIPYGRGSGGAGKNVFVEGPLSTVWGEAVMVAKRENVLGQWTGGCLGKIFIMIDENIQAQDDFNQLKAIIGNKRNDYNFKGGQKLDDMPNTAMYMMTSNMATCPIKLTDTAIDRRFSLWQIRRSVIEVLASRLGKECPKDDSDPAKQELLELFAVNKHRYSNPEAVAGWLGEIIAKWGQQKFAPLPYRGEDHQSMIDEKKGAFEKSFEEVFEWEKFEYISLDALYKRYVSLNKEEQGSQRAKTKPTYVGELKAIVDAKYPNIIQKPLNLFCVYGDRKYKKTESFIRFDLADVREKKELNDDLFIDQFGHAKTLWSDSEYGKETKVSPKQKLLESFN